MQFGTQLAPAAHRLDIVDARDQGAQHQAALHPLAEIAQPRPRPFLIGRGPLGDRNQRTASPPILQRRHLHLADLGAKLAERGDRRIDAAADPVADFVIHLMEMMDDADLQSLDPAADKRGVIGYRPVGARRIAPVVPRQGLQHQGAILGRPGHRSDMVEAESRRGDPRATDQTVGRLDAGDPAQRGRTADRAAGVGADAAEDQPSGNSGTGAAAAAGGEVLDVPRVARRWPGQIEARAAIGEFMCRRLADQYSAGDGEQFGAGSIGIGNVVLQDLRLAGRRDPLGIDDVLEADRDAMQRALRAARHDRRFGGARLGQRAFLGQVDKDIEPIVERMHAVETGAGQFDRGELPGGDQPRRLSDGRDRGGHAKSSSVKL